MLQVQIFIRILNLPKLLLYHTDSCLSKEKAVSLKKLVLLLDLLAFPTTLRVKIYAGYGLFRTYHPPISSSA